MQKPVKIFLFLMALASSVLVWAGVAQSGIYGSGLLVTPTRLVFDGNQNAQIFYVDNRGDKITTYRIGWKNYQMSPTGKLNETTGENDKIKFSESYFRYAPRQVTLKPGEKQTVRVAIKNFSQIPDGEYRSHMTFTAIPEVKETEEAPAKGVRVVINPNVSFSFPVIIRKGELSVKTGIGDVQLTRTNSQQIDTSLVLTREGSRSAYGNVEYIWVKPNGEEAPITQQRSVGVYQEVSSRQLFGRLPVTPEMPLNAGQLKIRYVPHYTDREQQPVEKIVPLG